MRAHLSILILVAVGSVIPAADTVSAEPVIEIRQFVSDAGFEGEGLVGREIPPGQRILVANGSLLEIGAADGTRLLRCSSGFDGRLRSPEELEIARGSVLGYLKDRGHAWILTRPKARIRVRGPGTFMVEATGNGAMKVIALEGELAVNRTESDAALDMDAGELAFVLAQEPAFGSRLHVDLALLLSTSLLVLGLEAPLPSMDALEQAAFVQSFKIKGKSNALVGGAEDDEAFQLFVLPGKENPPENP